MTITAEQVARAIEAARADEGGISDALGGWQWDKRAPDYVRVAWGKPSLPDFIAALTRWHAELVAVATPRAAEAERAAKPDHLAYADSPVWDDGPLPTPTPERPAPRFKEGDWVRHRESAGAWQVASFFEDSRGYVYCWNSHHSGFPEDVIVAAEVPGEPVPASPPAPEVVDVPQPIVKRCACPDVHDDVEAEWRPGEPYLTVTHTTVPLALLRAMLAAIDAQQGGPPKKWGSLDWLDEPEPTRPEPRYKVGDWVRVEGTGTVYQIGEIAGEYFRKMPGSASVSYKLCALTPAIDPALHETARKTVAWLRGGARGTGPADFTTLPGWSDWNSGSRWDAAEHWAAQLERLLGDAP